MCNAYLRQTFNSESRVAVLLYAATGRNSNEACAHSRDDIGKLIDISGIKSL